MAEAYVRVITGMKAKGSELCCIQRIKPFSINHFLANFRLSTASWIDYS